MGIMAWYNSKIKKLDVWDISALKTYCLIIGLLIGAYFPAFVKQYFWILVAVVVLLMLKLLYKVFKK